MNRCILTCPGRKLGYRFQAAEAWWILSGDDRVESIAPYSKTITQFSDDGKVFFGAYGPKVVNQLSYVVAKLDQDPQSRQAVINIWREDPPATRDYPCTLSLQLLMRAGEIHCIASMRSSDAWLGWPYDVFNFSCISLAVALSLDSRPKLGRLFLTVGSQHIYERNIDAVSKILKKRESGEVPWPSPPPLDVGVLRSADHLKSLLKEWADGIGSFEGLMQIGRETSRW
jgi:thymidylate synthase